MKTYLRQAHFCVLIPLILFFAVSAIADSRVIVPTPEGGGPGVSTAAEDLAIPFAGDPEPGWEARRTELLESAYARISGAKAAPYDDLGGDDVLAYTRENIRSSDMAIADNGDIYIVLEVYEDGTGSELRFLRSTDGGDSFSYWGRLYHIDSGTTYSRPSIVVAEGTEDRLFVAYRYKTPSTYYVIQVNESELAATPTFGTPQTVMSVTGSNFDYPDLASDNHTYSGYYLYLVAEDNDTDGGDIWYARSLNQNASWESAYEIGSLPLTDREYNKPKVCYGFGGYVHVGWAFYPRTGATFDAAARTRRCPGSGGGGLANWEAIIYLTSSSDGINDYDVHLAASTNSDEVIVAHRRLNDAHTVQTAGYNVSTDAGDNYGPQTLLPVGTYSVEDMLYQSSTSDFLIYGTLGSSGIHRANRLTPTSWSSIEYFGDVAYFNGIGTDDAFALDPSHGDRVAVAWPYIGYDYEEPVQFYFDAEWRNDPGYPNLEDGFPLALTSSPRSNPAVVDLDHDGDLEIVFSDTGQNIVVLHHDGSAVSGWPVTVPAVLSNGPVAIGNMDLGDRMSLLVGTEDGRVFGYWEDGTLMDGFPYQMPTTDPCFVAIGALGGPYKRTAAVVGGPRIRYLNHHGESPLGTFGWIVSGVTFSHAPAIGDIDDDGVSEVVVAGNNRIVAVRMYDSPTVLSRSMPVAASASPSLADFDFDGDVEIVVPCINGSLYVMDGAGVDLPGWPQTLSTGTALTSAAIAQLLGLSAPEIAVAEQNWTVNLFYINGAQANSWPEETAYGWYLWGAPIIGRVDGEVSSDVIIGDRGGEMWSWNNISQVIPGWPKTGDTYINFTPAMGDLDEDGSAEIVFLSQTSLFVVDINNTLNSGTRHWPMHGYDPQRTACLDCPQDILTAVGDEPDRITRLSFAAPMPNPSPGNTVFSYSLPERAQVKLEIYDVKGRRVVTVLKAEQGLGPQTISWDGRDREGHSVAGGTYFARLQVNGPRLNQELTRKMIILR
jgi:FlgD Ig-like domain